MARDHVTVGIVGGGVAGLTLAKMLEMIGVSYILYEGYHDIAPAAGASLGLMPNGLRILDQLGIIDQVEAYYADHDRWDHRNGKSGKLIKSTTAMRTYRSMYLLLARTRGGWGSCADANRLAPARFGYGAFFMARQDVLRLLYESLDDKSRVRTSKRVVSIQHCDEGELVQAADGSSFVCDILAGADGVRSVVREQILAETTKQPPV